MEGSGEACTEMGTTRGGWWDQAVGCVECKSEAGAGGTWVGVGGQEWEDGEGMDDQGRLDRVEGESRGHGLGCKKAGEAGLPPPCEPRLTLPCSVPGLRH